MKPTLILLLLTISTIISCTNKPLSKQETIVINNNTIIADVKKNVENGDLILRMGNDIMSEILRDISPKERKYSHVGLIKIVDGVPMVYNINPESKKLLRDDTIRLENLDSFITPTKNIAVAVYRFSFDNTLKNAILDTVLNYQHNKTRFDMQFNFADDSAQYCSELITKSLEKATANKYTIARYIIDSTKVIGVKKYLSSNNIDFKKYPVITLDNMYLNAFTKKIMEGTYKTGREY